MIEEKVENLVKQKIENLGYSLYDVEYKKEGKDYVFSGICKNGNLEEEIYTYFDLDRN